MDGSMGLILLGVEILLLIAGYVLFQQAKADLTARAAQMPVVSEVKALQKSIAALIEQLKLESVQTSAQLEARCIEARELLASLDRRLDDAQQQVPAPRGSRRRIAPAAEPAPVRAAAAEPVREPEPPAPRAANPKYQEVYTLTDQGLAPAEIARNTGLSEGEVELILGLRAQNA